MRRLLATLLTTLAVSSACGGAAEPMADEVTDEPVAAPEAPRIPGTRAIDRARDAAAAVESRALQHDTLR